MFFRSHFTHSSVTSEAAAESPTAQLVQYLIDAAHESLSADNLASHATAKVLLNARHFLTNAEEGMIEEDFDGEVNPGIIEQAIPIIADLEGLVPGEAALHSLVINWCDHDMEQGTFGTTVRARDHTHAEYLARRDMELSEDAGNDFNGTIVEHSIGATWKAAELETALRNLVRWAGGEGIPSEPLDKATALLAEIDAI